MEARKNSQFALLFLDQKNKKLIPYLTNKGNNILPEDILIILNQGEFVWSCRYHEEWLSFEEKINDLKQIKNTRLIYPNNESIQSVYELYSDKLLNVLIEFNECPDNGINLVSYEHNGYKHNFSVPQYIDLNVYDNKEKERAEKMIQTIESEKLKALKEQKLRNEKKLEEEKKDAERKKEIEEKKKRIAAKAQQFGTIFSAISADQIREENVYAVEILLSENRHLAQEVNDANDTPIKLIIKKILEKLEANESEEKITPCYEILKKLIRNGATLDLSSEQDELDWFVVYFLGPYALQNFIINDLNRHDFFPTRPLLSPVHEGSPRAIGQAATIFDGYQFNINDLDKIPMTEVNNKLFDDINFLAEDNENNEYHIKLGNIYIHYKITRQPAFDFIKVYEVDAQQNQLRKIYDLNANRYHIMLVKSILPFNVISFNPNNINSRQKKQILERNYKIRKHIVQSIFNINQKKLSISSNNKPVAPKPVKLPASSATSGSFINSIFSFSSSLWETIIPPTPPNNTKEKPKPK